ncbi:Shikimate 5-dehydrogenase I alpha [Paramagnetospirillum magnetotacticum MS-1]|uniref:Shikimate dehydrogenase (NADP(+)) n=1 Tax=Paramagnetospirillum magnetotacticum MS-1 TaxID=272627 RepID=A0A0C2UYJ0_PARME|nr:shikimate dehydrogenase [Paramagnetospirillum magnetotacticum]KIL97881.1 Shikimate 5-dehydrogenase I alpha [Paramagnetospirillum magnetotacticum MS-1]
MIVSGKARLAGVLGWPVSHSRSPRLHGFWLKQWGIDGAYLPLAVAPENLECVIRALPRMGFRGANVTVPHKEAVMRLVDHLDPLARRIGAVNTLVVRDDGSLEGRNTDAYGFFENLRQGCPAWTASSGPAAVIGAGGAARAVVAALADAGVPEIRLANRSRERAEALAADLGGPVKVVEWSERAGMLDGCALLVNTTTLGMTGQSDLDLDLAALPTTAVVNDIVYVPLETDLLVRARARGNATVDGLGMLLHQAVPGFEAWFGQKPQVSHELRAFVLS